MSKAFDPNQRCFYRNFKDQTCIPQFSRLFTSLGNKEKVVASLGDSGVSSENMMAIHNHLDSSNMWKKKTSWVTEVEYTIPHPDGDVVAFDTSSGEKAKLSRDSVVLRFAGNSKKEDWGFSLTRTASQPSDRMDLNTTRFSRVKVMNTKRFFYETDRSSWVFKLVVSWEGLTKEEAKKNGKKYFVYVESVDNFKTTSNPSYSAASFLEKILDIVPSDGERQVLQFN